MTLKEAIARIILHTEIVVMEVEDSTDSLFLMEEEENVSFIDYVIENNGDWDVEPD
jgi:hypothetical protein